MHVIVVDNSNNKADDMAPRDKVTLTRDERHEPGTITTKGERTALAVLHSQALLLVDVG